MYGKVTHPDDWLPFKGGGRHTLFIAYGEKIGKFIDKNKLTPASANPVLSPEVRAEDIRGASSSFIPWWYKGGKKFAHLHYQGEAYLLNAEQWKDFSTQVVEDMSKKMAASRNVSFTGVLELSDAISEMNSFI
jgi:hypothetical protein